MIRKSTLVTALLALSFLGLAACDDATSPGQNATLSVQLTDAPSANVENAWVKIDQITLQGSAEAELLDGPTGFIELTQLADSTETLVQNTAVPQGSYGQLRFHVNAAALETDGGTVHSLNGAADSLGLSADGQLNCPSCTQTGIKVNMPDGSLDLATEATILVLDFDVKESFGQEAGASGMWVMHPTISSSTVEASGTISGTVSAESGVSFPTCDGHESGVTDFVPQALAAGTDSVVKTGEVDSDGRYEITFLASGEYGVAFADSVVVATRDTLAYEATASQTSATVDAGSQTTVDYTISSVSCLLSD